MFLDQAFFDAYVGVDIRLPNRPPILCRPLTIAAVAELMADIRLCGDDDAAALLGLMTNIPKHLRVSRKSRRIIMKLRGLEALKLVERLLGAKEEDDPKTKTQVKKTAKLNLVDCLFEYEQAYGRQPTPDEPWCLFVEGIARARMHDQRRLAHVMTGTRWAIGSAFSKDPEFREFGKQVLDMAYPGGTSEVDAKQQGRIITIDDRMDFDEAVREELEDTDGNG